MKLNLFMLALWSCCSLWSARAASLVTTPPASVPSLSAAGNSFAPVLSDDGRRVFFLSHAPNLRTNEVRHDTLQLFVRDLITSNITLVSAMTNGQPFDADFPKFNLSSNGQFVAFSSDANYLVPADNNNLPDMFVRDATSNTTRLVTLNRFGVISPQTSSTNRSVPLISADGRFVFFESSATDLTQEWETDFNQASDIFRRDMRSNVTILVTRSYPAPYNAANAGSSLSSITPDGRHVAFISTASDVGFGFFPSQGDVYVRDFAAGFNAPVRASAPVDFPGGYRCANATISEDGQFVAFVVNPINSWPVMSVLYHRDLQAPQPVAIATNITSAPQISADGRYILFEQETNVFRFDTTLQTNELVNVTLTGAPTNGVTRDAVMTPDGSHILFNSDITNLTTNTVSGYHLYARDMAAGTTRLITLATNGLPSATHQLPVSFSATADGSLVAFDSFATDIVSGDVNRASDVFLRDVRNETTTLISRQASGGARQSGRAHAFINSDCLSADGRFVVFSSYDSDLLPDDVNGRPDVFVRELTTGTLTTTGFSTNAACSPAISADGRYVVYLRRQPGYSFETTGGAVYRFDRQTGTNELVSLTSASVRPAISSNGQWIAFLSNPVLLARDMLAATNHVIGTAEAASGRDASFTPDGTRVLFASIAALTPNTTSGQRNLFAWHTAQHTNLLISQNNNQSVGFSGAFATSGNSRFVSFFNANDWMLHRFDLVAGTNQPLRFGANRPALSADGNSVACVSMTEYPNRLMLLNASTGEELPVLTNSAPFNPPLLSPDGRWVVYARRILTPVEDTTVARYGFQLFAWDRLWRTNYHLSRSLSGTNANATAGTMALAADGRTVVFHSAASDLVPDDYNDRMDVFVLKLGGGDSDGDGMDDDWEVAYFGNLSRDGTGDFDADGASDRTEFLSATDPTNGGSVFRVITLGPVNGGSRQLLWQGNPVRSYRAEYKDDLGAANWTTLQSSVSWNGSTGSATDFPPANSTNRYYRVVLLP